MCIRKQRFSTESIVVPYPVSAGEWEVLTCQTVSVVTAELNGKCIKDTCVSSCSRIEPLCPRLVHCEVFSVLLYTRLIEGTFVPPNNSQPV
jgi:hypothetical protein